MKIKLYGADWCADCIQVKKFFKEKGLTFDYIVITKNEEAISFLEKVNKGKRVIPTLEIEGQVYTNPGINELINIIKQ
jgi:thioredoxin reductase (NADPH)